jgi:hypothetical protein
MPDVLADVKFLEGLLARDEVLAQRVRQAGAQRPRPETWWPSIRRKKALQPETSKPQP